MLVNLGTPDRADAQAVRVYLREFLSDARVIEKQTLLWKAILNGIILTVRPRRKAKDYLKIWNTERNESPLKTITRGQSDKLAASLDGSNIVVDWAMRYGNPSIASGVEALRAKGCDRIVAVPLYPQYSAATTATVGDKLFDHLKTLRWQPAIRVAAPYADDPVYIDALAASLRAHLAKLDFEPEAILVSFHGVPKAYLDKGDPYYCQCMKTHRLLREKMGWPEERFIATFQSRFGKAEWLKPYTDETVKALAATGVKKLAVIAPGFSADCLETIEELGVENARYFQDGGGETFALVPCLNDSDEGMRVIQSIVARELGGWV